MHLEVLHDLVVVFGVGLLVVLVCSRMRIPSIVGFLLTGIVVGPQGLQLVKDTKSVEHLAEIGVVVLLFTIGVEFSLSGMVRLGKVVSLGGSVQVFSTGVAAYGASRWLGLAPEAAFVIGCAISLSSTAIVMRLLSDRAQTSAPHGQVCLGMLIFQDLAVVPMVLLIPIVAGQGNSLAEAWLVLLQGLAVVGAVLVVARKVVPWMLHQVLRTRNREMFLLLLVVLCIGTAWLTSELGMSLALGAFLAGLLVSESEYSHHALSEVLPFRDAFLCLFFVSIGMLLDVSYVASEPWTVLEMTLAIMAGKAVLATVAALVLGSPFGIALLGGIMLSQIGEFSLILLQTGRQADLVASSTHALLLAVTVISMAVTPFLTHWAPRLFAVLIRALPESHDFEPLHETRDHVVIVGYGLNGQNVTRVLNHVKMDHVIIELNPETVRRLRKEGRPAFYGDATRGEVLSHARIEKARVLVVAIPDAASGRAIVREAKRLNPGVHAIVRTHLVQEVEALFDVGADEVVPEEFETSIEIFCRVLRQYTIPREQIEQISRKVRSEGYEMFRGASEKHRPLAGLRRLLADVELEVYGVFKDSPLAGKTLAEAAIPKKSGGALVLAIHRDNKTHPNPAPDWQLQTYDVVVLLGTSESLGKAGELFGSVQS